MNVISIYDRFMYCWFIYANIKLSLVVGWIEVELSSVLGLLWLLLCEEGVWDVNYRNRVDCEAKCGSLNRFYQVLL